MGKINRFYFILFSIISIIIIILLTNYALTKSSFSKNILNHYVDKKLKLLENRNPDIYFFGSSTTHYGLSAKTVANELNKLSNSNDIDVFNFGTPSASLLEQSFLLQHLIAINKKPKAVVLPYFSTSALKTNTGTFIYYPSLYIYQKYQSVYDYLELYYKYNIDIDIVAELIVAKNFKVYLFRKDIKKIFKWYLQKGYINKARSSFKGTSYNSNYYGDLSANQIKPSQNYEKVYNMMNGKSIKNLNTAVNFNGMKGLNRIIDICKKENIKVYLTYIPSQMEFALGYKDSENIKNNIYEAKQNAKLFAKTKEIYFIDPTKEIEFSPLNTADNFHLNKYTAKLLGYNVAQYINKLQSFDKNSTKLKRLTIEASDDWITKYKILKQLNETKEPYKDKQTLYKMFKENDFVFEESFKNIMLNPTQNDIDMLIDIAFKKYNKNGLVHVVRYVSLINSLIEIELSTEQESLIINYLTKININIVNIKLNTILKFLQNSNNVNSKILLKKYLSQIILSNKLKNDLSPLFYSYDFIKNDEELKNLISEKDLNKIKSFIDSGVIK